MKRATAQSEEAAMKAEQKAKEEMIPKIKKGNFADEAIAKIVAFPLERIRAIQV